MLTVLTTTAVLGTAHKLKVVNDDQSQTALLGQDAAALGAQFVEGQVSVVVNHHRRVCKASGGGGQPLEVAVVELTLTHPVHIHSSFRTQHPQHKLDGRHLEREHRHSLVATHTHVLANSQRQGGVVNADILGYKVSSVWHGQVVNLNLTQRLHADDFVPVQVFGGE